ncbi:MAG: hypothetical protein ACEPOZ_02315 [Marinifilaceae bacterium]
MNGKSKNQLPDNLRELKLKLEALDSLMLFNAIERGGTPYLPLPEINEEYEQITTTNYRKSLLN